jgi:hypothetical protein
MQIEMTTERLRTLVEAAFPVGSVFGHAGHEALVVAFYAPSQGRWIMEVEYVSPPEGSKFSGREFTDRHIPYLLYLADAKAFDSQIELSCDVVKARRHLEQMGWSYRSAAKEIRCHHMHLTHVLTGRRVSRSLCYRIFELGPRPVEGVRA